MLAMTGEANGAELEYERPYQPRLEGLATVHWAPDDTENGRRERCSGMRRAVRP